MTPKAAQKAKERAAKRNAGLVPLFMWVPANKLEACKNAIADVITDALHAEVAPK